MKYGKKIVCFDEENNNSVFDITDYSEKYFGSFLELYAILVYQDKNQKETFKVLKEIYKHFINDFKNKIGKLLIYDENTLLTIDDVKMNNSCCEVTKSYHYLEKKITATEVKKYRIDYKSMLNFTRHMYFMQELYFLKVAGEKLIEEKLSTTEKTVET